MQDALGIVIFATVIIAAIIAVGSLFFRNDLYDQIGSGGLSLNDGKDRGPAPTPTSPAAVAVRDEEIRQMLEAQNARRERRGQPPLDIEEELRRLTAGGRGPDSSADPELRDEVRQLVLARNARRLRRGQEPLDVEAEIDRQLAELA